MTRGAWNAWQSATCAASLWLAGCDAFDDGLLRPYVPGTDHDRVGSLADSGIDASTGAGMDGGEPPRDAALPWLPDDAAFYEDAQAPADADEADAGLDAALPGDAEVDGGSCISADATDYCAELPMLAAAPVIDGELDCGPSLMPMTPTAWNSAAALPAGHTTRLAIAHRPDGLYVYIEVHGQAPAPHPAGAAIYCGDAIELYLDADAVIASNGAYDAPGTVQVIAAAPASLATPNAHAERFVGGASQGAWASTQYQVAWRDDGYALEAFIVAADLGLANWSPATSIGLDIVIDVAGPAGSPDLRCGLQLGQYFMRVSAVTPSSCGGEPWCDARAFCSPALL